MPSPSPDESGAFASGRVFGGVFCTPIPTNEVRAGDYIEFNRRGMRVRKVKTVHQGRKHNFVKFVPSKYNPFKNQRVDFKEVKSVWRKRSSS